MDESKEDREARLKEEAFMTLKTRASRYSFLDKLGGLVNLDCKPGCVIHNIIHRFSTRGATIFYFFSGGSVLKSAFELGRECFVYSDSRKESEFLKLYPNILRTIPGVERFWEKVGN